MRRPVPPFAPPPPCIPRSPHLLLVSVTDPWNLPLFFSIPPSVKLSARSDTLFADVLVELTTMIHESTPTKAAPPAATSSNGSGTLKVLPSGSPKQREETKSKDSPKASDVPGTNLRSRSGSSATPPAPAPSRAYDSSESDHDGVYTHFEESSSSSSSSSSGERSDCCVIM